MNKVTNQSLAPDYRFLLGKPDADTPIFRTPMGINLDTNGYDRWRKKWVVKRTPAFLTEQGAGHLVEIFRAEAEYIRDVGIPQIVDSAFDDIRAKWMACGGKWFDLAKSMQPSSITVVIEPKPFWVPEHNVYANGMATDKEIRVVVMGSRLLYSDPKNASIVSLKSLLEWETGNLFEYRLNKGKSIEVSEEIGNSSPCGKG
jgi:hypothetical protein